MALLLLVLPGAFAPAVAQQADATAEPALTCWLKVDRVAVRVGEPFGLALTCSALETPALAALPDLSTVEPATLQVPPFEVLGGVRHPDILAGTQRFLQFEYRLRLVADGWFGRDVSLPPLTLKYTLAVRRGGDDQQGRERTYVLPSLPIRILSLVPLTGGDLRDVSPASFARIERHRLRGQAATAAAVALFAFAGAFLLLSVSAGLAGRGARAVRGPRRLGDAALLDASLARLRRLRADARTCGWTPGLLGEALAAMRVAAAVGMGQAVGQQVVPAGTVAVAGQLVARQGLLRPRRVLLSASATAATLDRYLAAPPRGARAARRAALAQLRDSIAGISAYRYSRGDPAVREDAPAAAAVAQALGAAAGLRRAVRAPARLIDDTLGAWAQWRLAWKR
jgi:hypothetical protein